jgi:predicted nuclease of predicted toxin-antitoxin system
VKFVLDMNLSPAWAIELAKDAHDVVHWRDVGASNARDDDILTWAATDGRIVVTADLDFGAAIATRGLSAPSVVQLRTASNDPDVIGAAVRQALRIDGLGLSGGAILTISHGQVRLRVGPLQFSPTDDV